MVEHLIFFVLVFVCLKEMEKKIEQRYKFVKHLCLETPLPFHLISSVFHSDTLSSSCFVTHKYYNSLNSGPQVYQVYTPPRALPPTPATPTGRPSITTLDAVTPELSPPTEPCPHTHPLANLVPPSAPLPHQALEPLLPLQTDNLFNFHI